MEEIRLHVIGRPRLEVDGRVLPLGGKMPEQLLCYLACKGGVASNHELSSSLWPCRTPDESLKQNLNRAISNTRSFLQDITGVDNIYHFIPKAEREKRCLVNIKVDLDVLINLTENLELRNERPDAESLAAVEAHFKSLLQRHDLLEGMTWDWILPFREELARIRVSLVGSPYLPRQDKSAQKQSKTWAVPLPKNESFTGRDLEISMLREMIVGCDRGGPGPAIAIFGEGGMGKTELALQYCHLYRDEYDHVFWVNCESRGHIQDDLAQAYLQFHGRHASPDDPRTLGMDRALAMRVVLRGLSKCLIVLDNADDPEALIRADEIASKEAGADAGLFKPLLKMTGAHRLITTRAPKWGDLATPIRLKSLTDDEGALLYLRRALAEPAKVSLEEFTQEDREAGHALAKELGGLALALDQAGLVTHHFDWTPRQYLHNFSERFDELLSCRPLASRHELAVMATFEGAVESVRQKCPEAKEFLMWCAHLPASNIPIELFKEFEGVVRESIRGVEVDKCLLAARNQSLIQYRKEPKTISMHHLVQQVLRFIDSGNKDGAPQRYEDLAEAARSVMPGLSPDNWESGDKYSSVWRHLGRNGPSSPPVIQVLQRLVIHGIEAWGGMHVRDDASLAVTKAESWGKQSLEWARSNFLMAKLLHLQGCPEEGLPHALEARRIFDSTYGPRSTETLDSMEILGATLLILDRKDEAIKLYEESVSIAESTPALGLERVVLHRRNLACALWSLSDDRRALEILETVVADRERILEPDHADTLDARHLYANALLPFGRFAEAELIHRENLKKRTEKFGKSHASTLVSRQSLGSILLAQGHFQAACKELQTVIDARSSELNNGHPDALWAKHKLALTYWEMGRREDAIALEQEVLENAKQHLGPNQYVRIHAEETLAKWNEQMESESDSVEPV